VRPLPRPAVAGGMLVGIVAISTSAILARLAMGDDPGVVSSGPGAAPALGVAFWRTFLGAVVLAPFGWRAARRQRVRLDGPTHRRLAASGLALGLHFALFQGALALTTVASAVTLVAMSPVFVALGGWWFLREATERRTWVGMGMTILGAITIGVADASAIDLGPQALLGDAMAFGGAVAVSAYLLLGRYARRSVPATTYSAVVYGWAAAGLLVTAIVTGTELLGYDPRAWAAIAGIVVGPQLLGHTVFNALLSTVSATVVSIVVLAEPVGAGLLAWLVLAELPPALFYLGAPLVLLGLLVATVRPRGRPAAATASDPRAVGRPQRGGSEDER
jgi:drug/metabolite transporter (DMT)-like permease